jgi:hypothetical protein
MKSLMTGETLSVGLERSRDGFLAKVEIQPPLFIAEPLPLTFKSR